MLSFAAFAVISCGVNGQHIADRVSDLPGLNFEVTFEQFSGYLDLDNGHHLHYWMTTADGHIYPNNKPVVLWLNGGPGCSSLDGMLYEQGPIHVAENGSLYQNQFAWNQYANMLFLEAPICVGFSYSDDLNCSMNDDTTADENYQALLRFFKKFPNLAENDFFVTGESYGGVYVPTLTRRILQGNAKNEGTTINLKGFAVGNGLSSSALNVDSSMWFAFHHGIIGEDQWDRLTTSCCSAPYTRSTCRFASSSNKKCRSNVDAVLEVLYSGQLNWYNIYGDCLATTAVVGAAGEPLFSHKKYIHELSWIHRDFHESNGYEFINALRSRFKENVPCLDTSGADIFLNRNDVRKALHISPKVTDKWSICSSTLDYEAKYDDLSAVYRDIFALDHKIYALVYNGDTDLSCNFLMDEWFVDDLELPSNGVHREWYFEDANGKQIGGWTKDFDRLSFVTVRGSGHMVPQYKPMPALKMFDHFLLQKPL